MIRRRKLLGLIAAVPFASVLIPRVARAEHYIAKVCGNCSFGSKKDNCARCGKWRGSTAIPARLCSEHGFGSKGDNCVVCGNWVGSSWSRALLCSDCGFGSKRDNCVLCGKWAP
ncbi:MAG: hypothetical protein IRZ16_16470 [Myxococcaceae bacterium]|nr:hypothetical protein [Myxococcaceae bacterium]